MLWVTKGENKKKHRVSSVAASWCSLHRVIHLSSGRGRQRGHGSIAMASFPSLPAVRVV